MRDSRQLATMWAEEDIVGNCYQTKPSSDLEDLVRAVVICEVSKLVKAL
jgi:hypothetical protein